MSHVCNVCSREFNSQRAMIMHSEAAHGRSNVHRGVVAWERSRNQSGELTHVQSAHDYEYNVDPNCWNEYAQTWECPMRDCDRCFAQEDSLRKHLNSGVHEDPRYHCGECERLFVSFAALNQHLSHTGHSRRAERAVHNLLADANSRLLMITDGRPPPTNWEGTLFFDGAARPNPGDGGCGWMLLDHEGREVGRYYSRVAEGSRVTSNQAEYEGLYRGLRSAYEEGMRTLIIKGDSELVIRQIQGQYQVRSDNIVMYYDKVMKELKKFRKYHLQHIPRDLNTVCDGLAKDAIDDLGHRYY
jgi:ribonuclease HI